jgi:hypothetical protein
MPMVVVVVEEKNLDKNLLCLICSVRLCILHRCERVKKRVRENNCLIFQLCRFMI